MGARTSSHSGRTETDGDGTVSGGRIDSIGELINSLDRQTSPADMRQLHVSGNMPKGEFVKGLPTVVVVDKDKHQTHVLQKQGADVVNVLTVRDSVGKLKTPTPEGRHVITDKRLDPIWTPPKSIDKLQRPVAPFKDNPKNPIGKAFIRLDGGSVGLHGTNRPDQIGQHISHGCVRHNNEDILKIYPMVKPGTPVYITPNMSRLSIQVGDFR